MMIEKRDPFTRVIWSKTVVLFFSQLNILCTSLVIQNTSLTNTITIHPLLAVHTLRPLCVCSNVLNFIEARSDPRIKTFSTLSGVHVAF